MKRFIFEILTYQGYKTFWVDTTNENIAWSIVRHANPNCIITLHN